MAALHTPILAALALMASAAGAVDLAALGGASFQVPVTSLKQARFKTTLHQQYDFSCGSAAVATLLSHHYAFPVSEQFVFEQMYLNGDQQKIRREGFSLLDIKRFLATQGFMADGFELPLDKLTEAAYPAIVLVVENGYNHFVVIKGLSASRVLIGDPAGGTRALARSSFDAMWRSKLLFVIHDRSAERKNLPVRFNDVAEWRLAPSAPLEAGINRHGLDTITLPKLEQGNF